MTLLCVIAYIFLISVFGSLFLRKSKMDPLLISTSGFMVGSVILGGVMFALVNLKLIYPVYIIILLSGIFVAGIFGFFTAIGPLKEIKEFLFSKVYKGKYRLALLILILFGLVLYLIIAYSPPRDADAMRYHLAQMKDTVKHHGFVYRPYYHYNLPQYFHYLYMPIFMLVGGTGVQITTYFYFILLTFLTIYLAYRTDQTRQLLFLSAFLMFIPRFTRSSTIAGNDMAVTFYGLMGLLLILEFGKNPRIPYLLLAYLSLGFALGCKYQAVLYFPVFILTTILEIRRHWKLSLRYLFIIVLTTIPFIIASPFFIRNFYYTGDPVWPLMADFFRVKKDYFYQIAQMTTELHQGKLNFIYFIDSIRRFATDFQVIPIIWLLWIGYYFTKLPYHKFYKIGTITFFCFWFLIQPKMYIRFVIFIIPIVAIMAISFCEWFNNKFLRFGKYIYILPILSIGIGIGFSIVYSLDFLEYQVTRDLTKYHQSTWFYNQYEWMNKNLADDGKVLIILRSGGHTYYLDKEYVRAEPELSGLIDWTAIKETNQFKSLLKELNVKYIFYEDEEWDYYPGGDNLIKLINELKNDKRVITLFEENELKLVYSRIFRKYLTTRVFLIDLRKWE